MPVRISAEQKFKKINLRGKELTMFKKIIYSALSFSFCLSINASEKNTENLEKKMNQLKINKNEEKPELIFKELKKNSLLVLDDYVPEGKSFQRKHSTAYLECYFARTDLKQGISNRSFEIKPKEGDFKGKVVGKIGIGYSLKMKRVEIGALDVEEKYRKMGYGEAALRTALGIYRNEANKDLDFSYFFVSVGTGEDREVARKLYKKVGFETLEDHTKMGIPYFDLKLDR